MKIGYVRVSTATQNTARQDVLMTELGVDRVFVDKLSGKNTERPSLQEMLSFAREGDMVIVESISRMARNVKDMLSIIEQLTEKNVSFVSKKESIDTTTPAGRFMLTVFGALAELERSYILERQYEGIQIAKANGKYRGGQKIKYDKELFEYEYKQWKNGDTAPKFMMKRLGLKSCTFYRRVKEYEIEHGIITV